jgi:hypothetical protein
MKRNDQTPCDLAYHPRYPPHTLAPDPRQPELALVPPRPVWFTTCCPRCASPHRTKAEYQDCIIESRR